MPFIKNAETVAQQAMHGIDPSLKRKFATIVRLLASGSVAASKLRGKNAPQIGTKEYISRAAQNFAQGRIPKRPEPPATVPDEMVSFVLEHYFDVPAKSLEHVRKEHKLSMGAENIVGDLLERYLAKNMEAVGWVWCSGSLIKGVDFVKAPKSKDANWILLQVKNRDNSENSSSSAIRAGTTIEKWHRTFSLKPGTNWESFPDNRIQPILSESKFRIFAKVYLKKLKRTPTKQPPTMPITRRGIGKGSQSVNP